MAPVAVPEANFHMAYVVELGEAQLKAEVHHNVIAVQGLHILELECGCPEKCAIRDIFESFINDAEIVVAGDVVEEANLRRKAVMVDFDFRIETVEHYSIKNLRRDLKENGNSIGGYKS